MQTGMIATWRGEPIQGSVATQVHSSTLHPNCEELLRDVVMNYGCKWARHNYCWQWMVMPPNWGDIQWVKKLSQCLAILERLTQNKSDKLCNNMKIIYVILGHLSFQNNPRSCDLDQNWWSTKQNKTPYHWDSFLTLYYFSNTPSISAWTVIGSSPKVISIIMWLYLNDFDMQKLHWPSSFHFITIYVLYFLFDMFLSFFFL